MTPKTLDSALEIIANQDAQIQGLEKTISEQETRIGGLNADLDACMSTFGITKKTENETITLNSSHLQAADAAIVAVNAERDQLKEKLTAAETRIAELEKEQKSVSARARELLASQGGKPLPVSGNGSPKANNRVALSEQLDEANRAGNKEEVKRIYAELSKIKN